MSGEVRHMRHACPWTGQNDFWIEKENIQSISYLFTS